MANDLRERLAAYAHDAWSGWMKWQFGKAPLNDDGTWTMPAEFVERWQRQMTTPYAELPEHEKHSDRKEADEMLAIVGVEWSKEVPTQKGWYWWRFSEQTLEEIVYVERGWDGGWRVRGLHDHNGYSMDEWKGGEWQKVIAARGGLNHD